MHGKLYLEQPLHTLDLIHYKELWYVPFPPLPALLMLPFVALFGPQQINAAIFSLSLGALNVTLVYLVLETLVTRGWSKLGTRDNLVLVCLFGLGSVHWYLAIVGDVWFISQISTLTFVLLATLLSLKRVSPWLVGTCLAIAILARPNIALTLPLLLGIEACLLQEQQVIGKIETKQLFKWSFAVIIPMLLAVACLLLYNFLRFENPTDFGYLQQNISKKLYDNLHTYGQFNLNFIPANFEALFLLLPQLNLSIPSIVPDTHGMSIFLTMPALLYLSRLRRFTPLEIGALVSLGTLLIPLLTYYNTGWTQFGYRFTLDFIVPLLILLAIALGKKISRIGIVLVIWGILVNGWGTFWFLINYFV
ncbi:MAG: hypothetical protein HXX08_11010 [Chloroflexi bacterium]|uniref:Uncharacterized protein n=1 Tax=Candidatus Chlorohelix allophototropha TaxID=3003348 RepID=A0A8T7LZF2_9CHLR|nr:hypothetical protein [Chloroflexota bacterium]WJW65767.1 hypothetical protein OZ401_001545 [Chloroflexota bacterium L227-S17]